MSGQTHIDELALQAFLDGELAVEERQAIEDAIARDPALAIRLAQHRADKTRLATLYGRLDLGPTPPEWIETIRRAPVRRGPSLRVLGAIAAALLVVAVGVSYYQGLSPARETIVAEALAARDNALSPRRSVDGPGVAAAASAIVASALAMPAKAPDLSRLGYRLAAVRVYAGVPGGKAVELLYRRADDKLFSLYVRRPTGAARFDQFREGRLRVCIWQDDVLGAVMAGEMSAAEMQRLASLAYSGLET
jgi:anti-sigma factor RsiW